MALAHACGLQGRCGRAGRAPSLHDRRGTHLANGPRRWRRTGRVGASRGGAPAARHQGGLRPRRTTMQQMDSMSNPSAPATPRRQRRCRPRRRMPHWRRPRRHPRHPPSMRATASASAILTPTSADPCGSTPSPSASTSKSRARPRPLMTSPSSCWPPYSSSASQPSSTGPWAAQPPRHRRRSPPCSRGGPRGSCPHRATGCGGGRTGPAVPAAHVWIRGGTLVGDGDLGLLRRLRDPVLR